MMVLYMADQIGHHPLRFPSSHKEVEIKTLVRL